MNKVAVFLTALIWLGGGALSFVIQAPNRLAPGSGLLLVQAAPTFHVLLLAGLAILLSIASLVPRARILVGPAAGLLVLVTLGAAGAAAAQFGAIQGNAARSSLGAGFWLMVLAGLWLLGGARLRLVVSVILAIAVALLLRSGRLDHLAILRELATHRAAFGAEFVRHLLLVAAALAPALLLGLPLAVSVYLRPRWQHAVFGVLSLIQTIPSIALFGLLMGPLAALHLPGIGFLPAVLALALYALLPIARNAHAGLLAVDPAVLDSARGLGFGRARLFWRLELPLALPLLLAGLRIATVQAIGLAVVAALVGAGGLGTFVFQGLGQDAIDLVLLGALPAVALAVAAHFLLRAAQGMTEHTV